MIKVLDVVNKLNELVKRYPSEGRILTDFFSSLKNGKDLSRLKRNENFQARIKLILSYLDEQGLDTLFEDSHKFQMLVLYFTDQSNVSTTRSLFEKREKDDLLGLNFSGVSTHSKKEAFKVDENKLEDYLDINLPMDGPSFDLLRLLQKPEM